MIQQTSLEAYAQAKRNLGEKQQIVLELLRRTYPLDFTNMEIAYVLGWPINRVTPRVYELRQMGYVSASRKRKCDITGFNAIAWKYNGRCDP